MDKNVCSSLEKLECDFCENPLSYFPISIIEGKFICGRCLFDDADAARVASYEVLAELHYFPCRYNIEGCTTELRPTDVPNHEKICTFRFVECLLLTCKWEGTVAHMMQHCMETHSQLILRENQQFDINLTSSSAVEKLIVHNNNLFTMPLIVDAQGKKLQFLILPPKGLVEKKDYKFYLTLESEKNSLTREFDVEILSETVYLNNLDKDTLTFTAFLTMQKTLRQLTEIHMTELSEKILETVKCTKCSNYILPPIYSDITGSNYCRSCVDKNTLASLNIALNNVVSKVVYCCTNSKYGCAIKGRPALMREHQVVCEYRMTNCILSNTFKKCQWENHHKELLNHLQEEHEINSNPSTVYFPITFSKHEPGYVSQCALFKFGRFFFVFVLTTYTENYVCCSVEVIGPVKEKFKYELEIVDINKTGDRIIMRKSCPVFKRFDDVERVSITKSDHFKFINYCNFQKDDIECFFERLRNKNGNNLHFKVHIINDVN